MFQTRSGKPLSDRFVLGMIFGGSVALWAAALPTYARLIHDLPGACVGAGVFTWGLIVIGLLGGRPWVSPWDRPWVG